eukprot:TRINITY_DN5645_c0_g1_i1.p1 TRINITY_DN5645_c0_g1~~TRINITY_DN5645_c0_g1_i1.p1  ORF type:complete len:194 (-),score=26.54 TRINITY_DN5645_c0_g1_i1:231-791(-)
MEERYKVICCKLLSDISFFAMHKGSTVNEVYESLDDLTLLLDEMRREQDWVRSVITRAYQFRRYVAFDFEKIRITHDYRTPSTLRSYAMVFTSLCPVLFAPYFAKLSRDFGLWAGIYCSTLAVSMLVTLYRVYYEQEDPCDSSGRDDLNIDIINQVVEYMYTKRKRTDIVIGGTTTSVPPEHALFK